MNKYKYETENNSCITHCPHRPQHNCYIGSFICDICNFQAKHDYNNNIVFCNYEEDEEQRTEDGSEEKI